MNNKIIQKNNFSFLVILSIFILDRISKLIVLKFNESTGETNLSLNSFLDINLIWNNGIAFGFLSFNEKIFYNLLTSLIILITLVLIWIMIKSKGLEKIGFSMIIGGSLGNISDRIYYSSVPDFIDFNINNFHWFIFNVADIFITVGIGILLYNEINWIKKK